MCTYKGSLHFANYHTISAGNVCIPSMVSITLWTISLDSLPLRPDNYRVGSFTWLWPPPVMSVMLTFISMSGLVYFKKRPWPLTTPPPPMSWRIRAHWRITRCKAQRLSLRQKLPFFCLCFKNIHINPTKSAALSVRWEHRGFVALCDLYNPFCMNTNESAQANHTAALSWTLWQLPCYCHTTWWFREACHWSHAGIFQPVFGYLLRTTPA